MRSLVLAILLLGAGAGLSACVVAAPPPGPHYGAHWVPGHYGPAGRWIPGHWA